MPGFHSPGFNFRGRGRREARGRIQWLLDQLAEEVQHHRQKQAYQQQQDQAVAHLGQFLAGAQTAGAAAVPSPEELERLSLKKDKHGRHDEQNFTEE